MFHTTRLNERGAAPVATQGIALRGDGRSCVRFRGVWVAPCSRCPGGAVQRRSSPSCRSTERAPDADPPLRGTQTSRNLTPPPRGCPAGAGESRCSGSWGVVGAHLGPGRLAVGSRCDGVRAGHGLEGPSCRKCGTCLMENAVSHQGCAAQVKKNCMRGEIRALGRAYPSKMCHTISKRACRKTPR